jgi:hypothetical protein
LGGGGLVGGGGLKGLIAFKKPGVKSREVGGKGSTSSEGLGKGKGLGGKGLVDYSDDESGSGSED